MPKLAFDYHKLAQQGVASISRYRVTVTALVVLLVFGFAILRIDTLSNPATNESRRAQKIRSLKKIKIDEAAAKDIQNLVDSNVEVNPDINNNRDNPFDE